MYLFLEFLTKAYNNACSEGEAEIYRAHVVVLGHSNVVKGDFIERLLDESISYSFSSPYGIKGIKKSLIESKFNKATQKTEQWRLSRRDSNEVMKDFRNAVLSHIRSLQHGRKAEREMELQKSFSLIGEDSEQNKSITDKSESIKNRKQDVRQNISQKLETTKKQCAAQFPKLDRNTFFFYHKNAQIEDASDNNIPYSINLWNYDNREEYRALNQLDLFLKAEALILYVMDVNLNLFSPVKRRTSELKLNENPKTSAEIMAHWLSSVHVQAKTENFKPNIVLLLTHVDSIREREQKQYIARYIQTIIDLVEGKPYADYISKENIISGSFNDIRGQLFDRIRKLPSWGVKKPIRWLGLELEILRYEDLRFARYDGYGKKPYLLLSEVKKLASKHDMDDYEIESFLRFHHVLGDFIYRPLSKGESCVITDPQLLMSIFGDVVSAAKRSKGIVSKEHLQCIWEIHDNPFLIDLMISFDFVLSLDNQKKTYLVPSMLPMEDNCVHDTELAYKDVHSPIVDDRSIPSFGTFHRLLSLCAQQSNWKLNISSHLSRYNASFDVTMGTHLVLTQKKNNTIQVSTWTSKEKLDKGQVSNDQIRAFLFGIHKEIARKAEVLGIEQSRNFRILCPHWKPGDEHLCLIDIEEKTEARSDNVIYHPKYDRCAMHNEVLDPHLFFVTDQYRKGMF